MTERLLPPREACRRLGISFVTLKRWIYSGKIRAVKTPTGRWMVPESEVERIIGGKAGVEEVRTRQELVEDLLAIVASFADKLYGAGSRRRKKLVEGFKKLLEEVERD